MKINTSDLTGAALDWAVKKLELASGQIDLALYNGSPALFKNESLYCGETWFNPSINWAQGGPIVERVKISVTPDTGHVNGDWNSKTVNASRTGLVREWGPTPLIAAMRCFVASKLGDEVEIPDTLL